MSYEKRFNELFDAPKTMALGDAVELFKQADEEIKRLKEDRERADQGFSAAFALALHFVPPHLIENALSMLEERKEKQQD